MDNERLRKKMGNYIREARSRAGLTQELVVEKTRININRIESGKRSMNILTFIKLVQVLPIDPSDFCKEFSALCEIPTDRSVGPND